MIRPIIALVALAVATVCGFARLWPPAVGSWPHANVLVVSVDTLRPDHLGTYGHDRPTSPAIDALSRRGVTFEKAFAPRGMTWPSLATMLTSLAPTTTNVRWNGQYLPDEVPTLPGILAGQGYSSAAFLGGSVCHMAKATGDFGAVTCGEDPEITNAAIEFFRGSTDAPFFAWVHLMATHAPYNPPSEHDVFTAPDYQGPVGRGRLFLDALVTRQAELSPKDLQHLNALYDGEVRFADAQVARLLAALDEAGLRENTVIVFTADHGEDLYQHNRYLYHACSIYDSALRIPLILALPGDEFAGLRHAPIVEAADVAPTLLELVGVDPLASFEGTSLLGRLVANEDERARIAHSEWYDPNLKKSLRTVRTSRWRYISNPEGLTPQCLPVGEYYKVDREELYDLSADPAESRNVVAEHPAVAARLASLLEAEKRQASDEAPLPLDPNLKEELRSLGYLQ